MQDLVEPDGKQTHIVVDGQQRILACLQFLEGKFELDPRQSPEFADLTFDELRDDEKQRIYEYRFVVRLLPKTSEPILRDIFQRLNRNNVALNAQELRHATYWGPFIQTMNRISDREYWGTTGLFTPNDVRRMLDVEFISELAVGMLHGLQNKKQSLDKWYTAYEKEFEHQERVEGIFTKILGELSQLIPDINRTRWRNKSDFYTLFLVLAAHETSFPLASDSRLLLAEKLTAFDEQVSSYIQQMGPGFVAELDESDSSLLNRPTGEPFVTTRSNFPRGVVQYAAAVQRAASDLANRRTRAKELESVLSDVWNLKKVRSSKTAKTAVK